MALNNLKKRIIRRQISREILNRKETIDGILWDVQADGRTCRVRVSGSDTLLTATFGQNIESNPQYLKPGNAVKLMRTGGNRHQLEVAGHGISIPMPVSTSLLPSTQAGDDAVISGLLLHAYSDPKMAVWIETGEIRIGGVEFDVEEMQMSTANIISQCSGAVMGSCSGAVSIAVASSSYPRIDIVQVGTNLALDVVTGTPSSAPVEPDPSSAHVKCGSILVLKNATAITDEYINRQYTAPFAAQIVVVVADDDLAYGENTTTLTVTVYDQNGEAITGTNWGITASIASGTGYIDGGTTATRYTGTSSASTTFTYTRNTGVSEVSPVIEFRLVQRTYIYTATYIILRDSGGNILG